MRFNELPDLASHDARWKPVPGRTRREFLRLLANVGVGVAVVSARVFDATAAWATHQTPSTEQTSLCYKCSGFASGTKCALCGSSVSSIYCGHDGWHSQHTVSTGSCTYRQHILRLTSCNGSNAWKWLKSTWGGTSDWRCSDGQARTFDDCSGGTWGSWYDTVCPKAI